MIVTFVSARRGHINGCTVEDILTFQAIVSEYLDLVSVNQNVPDVSQEIITFFDEKFCIN